MPLRTTLFAAILASIAAPSETLAGDAELSRVVSPEAGSADRPLLLAIGLHVEPLGAEVSALAESGVRPDTPAGRGARRRPTYRDAGLFERHREDILRLVEIVERHGGKIVLQVQTPFTQVLVERGDTLLADLERRGHEIALHLHEDAHLGRDSERLPVDTWVAVMKEEIEFIRRAGATTSISYWSGGNLYPGVLEAASRAGLSVMSDHKNPRIQRTEESLLGIHPWRPAGGPADGDVRDFARHDPSTQIVYLPDGIFSRVDHASMRRSKETGGDARYFDFLTEGLESSLAAARADRVNVFHITVHPGEFRGAKDGEPFAVIESWLAKVVSPLVAAGKIRWATFSEMAAAHREWEAANPGIDPRSSARGKTTGCLEAPAGYITFAVNIDDFVHVDQSADTILRLISLFERNGVRGDFYLTAPIAERYAELRPEVVLRLESSSMTISYHVRPPHPLYARFDQDLVDLSEEELTRTLRDYETYALDLATGELDRTRPGGYCYVRDLFGRPPVVVSAQNGNPRIRDAAYAVYRELGARMAVVYHESGTNPAEPLARVAGLVARPSDLSVTRWKVGDMPDENFWWNMLGSPRHADQFDPSARLADLLESWALPRAPFATALIHESNFYRQGPTPWGPIYYADSRKTRRLEPPYRLDAPDPSRARSPEDQEAIWKAYEELVGSAAKRLSVVTSEDIAQMAEVAGK